MMLPAAFVAAGNPVRAEEPVPAAPVNVAPSPPGGSPGIAAPPAESAPAPSRRSRPATKGKRIREKEAEGSQAPDRFEADTVIKSKYEHNGQPLEVDPD